MLDEFSVCSPARVWEKLREEEKDCAWLPASKFAVNEEETDAEGEALES
jgi:hypothetical protein